MPDNEFDATAQAETKNEAETTKKDINKLPDWPAGSYIGVDWDKKPTLELLPSHISALKELLRTISRKEEAARREEIVRVWEAELFYRGYQHLLPRRAGGWEFAGQGTGYGKGEQNVRSMFETNFYLSFGLSVISSLTRDTPKVRFAPVCPTDDADITAASSADKLKDIIIRDNNMLGLMADMATYLYTDGRAHFYTRYQKDGQRFGFKPQVEGLTPEEESAVPAEDSEEQEQEGSVREPRGREVITVHGALEVKVPIKANSISECEYLIHSREVDLAVAKGKYPDKADDIRVTRGGPAGDDIDRLARINVALGVDDNFITSDSEATDVTLQDAWLRPAALLEIKDEQVRAELVEMSEQTGIHLIWAGECFIEAKVCAIEDHWNMIFATPGRYGAHRPALGTSYIPAQKVVNNWLELANDYLINGIPMKYMDADTFDVEHIKDQNNTPGGIRPIIATPGVSMEQLCWVEPTLQFPQELLAMIESFGEGTTGQLLTGVYPALAGGDTGSNDTGVGMEMQRDNALGRIGLPWRNIKEGIATTMQQAVQNLANNHDEDIKVSGSKKGDDPIIVELQDLKGKYLCFPETDENFPQSPTEKKNVLDKLLQAALQDPTGQMAEVVWSPCNYELIKNGSGLPDLYIPKAAAYEATLGVITQLKKEAPEPNPALIQIQEQAQQLTLQLAATPEMAEQIAPQLEQLQQQEQSIPPQVPSVEVDPDVDDHETAYLTCLEWLRGPEGRSMKNGSDEVKAAYQNVKLYYMAQKELKEKEDAAAKKVPEKGISKSVTVGDLTKAGVPAEQAVEIIKNL